METHNNGENIRASQYPILILTSEKHKQNKPENNDNTTKKIIDMEPNIRYNQERSIEYVINPVINPILNETITDLFFKTKNSGTKEKKIQNEKL